MNVGASLSVGIYLLEHGGPAVVADAITLTKVFRDIQGGKTTAMAALTDANIDAAGRVLTVLATAAKDPSEKAQLMALAQS